MCSRTAQESMEGLPGSGLACGTASFARLLLSFRCFRTRCTFMKCITTAAGTTSGSCWARARFLEAAGSLHATRNHQRNPEGYLAAALIARIQAQCRRSEISACEALTGLDRLPRMVSSTPWRVLL